MPRKRKSTPKPAPEAIPEGADVPVDESDLDTSPGEAPEEPVEAPEPSEEPPEAPEAPEAPEEPVEAPEPATAPPEAPAAMTTYAPGPEPTPEKSEEAPQVPTAGNPNQYMIVRTRNHGWVIDEKWQWFTSFEAIQARVDSEFEAGHSGTLYRANRVIATWGDDSPARI